MLLQAAFRSQKTCSHRLNFSPEPGFFIALQDSPLLKQASSIPPADNYQKIADLVNQRRVLFAASTNLLPFMLLLFSNKAIKNPHKTSQPTKRLAHKQHRGFVASHPKEQACIKLLISSRLVLVMTIKLM